MVEDGGGFFGQLIDKNTGYSLIIEDDGEKAYAYLLNEARAIVCDVWLYNHGPAPTIVDWRDPSKLPFKNPAGYICDSPIEPIRNEAELSVEWYRSAENLIEARLFLRQQLFAILKEGERPGRSRMAIKNGLLAKVLESVEL